MLDVPHRMLRSSSASVYLFVCLVLLVLHIYIAIKNKFN